MPRGPGKKENYNLDYSRFNSFDRDEAEESEEASKKQSGNNEADAAAGMPDMRDLLRSMPPELQEAYHLMSVARENGDEEAQKRASALALKAVEKGGPEVKNAFMQNVAKQMPEISGKLTKDMSGIVPGAFDSQAMLAGLQEEAVQQAVSKKMSEGTEDADIRIDALRKQMEEGQKATRAELDHLKEKQEELERIRNPEDFFKFMQEEGITQEDLQRIFSGDDAHMQARFKETLDAKDVKNSTRDSADALKKVDELHSSLFGTTPEEAPAEAPEPEPAKEKPVRKAPEPPKEPEVTIPMYRLQYQKDEAGKYTVVELKCNLPGVTNMSQINLDVADRHLRLSTVAPAPRYAVNAGPFPVLIDPSGARAKYSKKRE